MKKALQLRGEKRADMLGYSLEGNSELLSLTRDRWYIQDQMCSSL
jgi:hypothetical protein